MRAPHLLLLGLSLMLLAACSDKSRDTGIEYAPAMYHSVPLEPYSQMDTNRFYYREGDLPGKTHRTNLGKPVDGTIAYGKADWYYPIPNTLEGYELAATAVKDPKHGKRTKEDTLKGEQVYLNYCVHCHGTKGDGKGSIPTKSKQYLAGVPNYSKGTVARMPDGQKYHSIHYGKNFVLDGKPGAGKGMGPHGSLISPEEIWQVILWVNKLRNEGDPSLAQPGDPQYQGNAVAQQPDEAPANPDDGDQEEEAAANPNASNQARG